MRLNIPLLALLLPLAALSQSVPNPVVRFSTNLGDIDVTLLPNSAPKTVANFFNYVNRGDFNNSIFHRSVRNFIIQGGGFQLKSGAPVAIPSDPAVKNEFSQSNNRGTLAMAKLGDDPNSATNQWFFNLNNSNAANLNAQNGGFTVFGRVANASSLAVMDAIAAVAVWNSSTLNAAFTELPLLNYTSGTVLPENYVTIRSITQLENPPAIASSGVITAGSFGAYTVGAPGSYIEIYGSNLSGTTREWAGADFKELNAPTTLDDVSVKVNGQPAYVSFISPGQVNVQIPANVPTIGTASVVVTYKTQSSGSYILPMRTQAAGLLAPASFNVGGRQYVAAVHASNAAYVTTGNIAGLPAAPAQPGETIVFFGTGFGPVTGVPVAGQIAQGATALAAPLQFKIGGLDARVDYKGFAPGLVGLYQFNVVIPATAPNGDLALNVILDGETIPQTLYIPVLAK